MNNSEDEYETNELAEKIEKQRRKWLSKIQQGGGNTCSNKCKINVIKNTYYNNVFHTQKIISI